MPQLLQFGMVNAGVVAMLALLVAAIERCVRRPALAHLLWVLVLLKLIAPPVILVDVDWPLAFGLARDWVREVPWFPSLVGAVWIAGAIVWYGRQFRLIGRFRRRLVRAAPAAPDLQERSDRLARELGLTGSPPVYVVPDVVSPMLSGIGRKIRLVFPSGLLGRLAPSARDTLLAHELAHFYRGDHWVRGLEFLVCGLYWWHPVVWWARRRIEAAEEECCDALVISRFAPAPRVYAEALLETIDFLSESALPLPPAATALGQVPLLRRRLQHIMRGTAPHGLSHRGRLAILMLAVLLLPVHPVLSRHMPQDRTSRRPAVDIPHLIQTRSESAHADRSGRAVPGVHPGPARATSRCG